MPHSFDGRHPLDYILLRNTTDKGPEAEARITSLTRPFWQKAAIRLFHEDAFVIALMVFDQIAVHAQLRFRREDDRRRSPRGRQQGQGDTVHIADTTGLLLISCHALPCKMMRHEKFPSARKSSPLSHNSGHHTRCFLKLNKTVFGTTSDPRREFIVTAGEGRAMAPAISSSDMSRYDDGLWRAAPLMFRVKVSFVSERRAQRCETWSAAPSRDFLTEASGMHVVGCFVLEQFYGDTSTGKPAVNTVLPTHLLSKSESDLQKESLITANP